LLELQRARELGCPWDAETCACAAQSGQLTLLHWARANGCPWSEETTMMAAYEGNLPMV
jgi:hypothetical protein